MGHNMSDFYSFRKEAEILCPVCGEMFQPAEQHAYYIGKNQKKRVCTYSCMRKWEKGEVKKLFSQGRKGRENKKYSAVRIVETGKTFGSIKECAEHLNTKSQNVHQAIKTGCHCRGFHIEEVKVGAEE
jgi:hypothetical protein